MRLLFSFVVCAYFPIAYGAQLSPQTLEAFENHPSRLVEEARRLQSVADVKRERAILFPRLSFETDGGTTLASNVDSVRPRALGESGYLDGMLKADQRLFDFGAAASRIRAAELNAQADQLGPEIALNQLVADAVALAREAQHISAERTLVSATLEQLKIEQQRAELRFQQGLDGPSEGRRLAVRVAEFEERLAIGAEALEGLEAQAVASFSVSLAQLRLLRDALVKVNSFDSNATLSLRKLEIQRQAKTAKTRAIDAEKYPTFSAELSGRLFDIDKDSGDYEIRGNLNIDIPFFDGGARQARFQQAIFDLRATEAEVEFEQRALAKRLSQLASRSNQLLDQSSSLAEQARSLQMRFESASLRQGKTEVGVGELADAILELHSNAREQLRVSAERIELADERIYLSQRWPVYFKTLKDRVIND